MKETKWYCDVCGKEITVDPRNRYIDVTSRVGRHGKAKRSISILDRNGDICLDFCEDCKNTIAILFGGELNAAD